MRRLDVRRTFQPVGRILRKFKRFEGETQRTREQLIQKLLEAIEAAHQRAVDPSVPEKGKLKAASTCAYLAQRVNKIMTDYDTMKIEEDIEELERKLKDLEEERTG